MGKLAVGVLAFVGGAVVGALAVRAYVQAHPLETLAPGAVKQLVEKVFGTGPAAESVADAAYTATDRLVQ